MTILASRTLRLASRKRSKTSQPDQIFTDISHTISKCNFIQLLGDIGFISEATVQEKQLEELQKTYGGLPVGILIGKLRKVGLEDALLEWTSLMVSRKS